MERSDFPKIGDCRNLSIGFEIRAESEKQALGKAMPKILTLLSIFFPKEIPSIADDFEKMFPEVAREEMLYEGLGPK